MSDRDSMCSTRSHDRRPAPSEVFYVVQTTAGPVGERQHCLRSPLYETCRQAQTELMHLQIMGLGNCSYSVWKSTTYVEPPDWLYDVVMSEGR